MYPSREMIKTCVEAGEYFIAEDDEITVIHALGVHPKYMGKGIAKQMVRFAIKKAIEI